MKFDFLQKLIDPRDKAPFVTNVPIRGKYVKKADGSYFFDANGNRVAEFEEKEITLQWIVGQSLNLDFPDERNLPLEDKRLRGKLIDRIYDTPECEISVQEATLICQCVGKAYSVMVLSAVEKIFNGGKNEKGEVN